MDTHKNARLTPKGREEMVRAVVHGGLGKAVAARKYNTTRKTVGKWVERFRTEGVNGLRDRSSKPHSSPSQIPVAVERLRRERHTQEHIAAELGISKASVSRILKRCGLSLLSSLEPQEPRPRYQREVLLPARNPAKQAVLQTDNSTSSSALVRCRTVSRQAS
jgi:transposase